MTTQKLTRIPWLACLAVAALSACVVEPITAPPTQQPTQQRIDEVNACLAVDEPAACFGPGEFSDAELTPDTVSCPFFCSSDYDCQLQCGPLGHCSTKTAPTGGFWCTTIQPQ